MSARSEIGDFTIRPYQPGDEQAIVESFNLVFREVCGEGYVDRDLAFWRWQFLENPCGNRITVGLTEASEVAAQYAGVPQRVDSAFGPATRPAATSRRVPSSVPISKSFAISTRSMPWTVTASSRAMMRFGRRPSPSAAIQPRSFGLRRAATRLSRIYGRRICMES